jgi:hypothetical protein
VICCEKLLSEAGDSSGTQRKGNVRSWKPIPSNGSADVTVDTSVCVCVSVCIQYSVRFLDFYVFIVILCFILLYFKNCNTILYCSLQFNSYRRP